MVGLNWDVSEVNQVTEFQVQRSADGMNFSAIGTVDAVAGQTGYSYADGNATGNVLYYRLQITRLGGGPGIQSDSGSVQFTIGAVVGMAER